MSEGLYKMKQLIIALLASSLSVTAMAQTKTTTTTTTINSVTWYPSCDAVYFSPVSFSHHWKDPEILKLRSPGKWDEVNESIAFDCKMNSGTIGVGMMKNSFDLDMQYVGATTSWKLANWFSIQAGVIVGQNEQPTWRRKTAWSDGKPTLTRFFLAPVLALTIAEGRFIAVDISHSPNGLSGGERGEDVAVTVARVRFKVM